MNTVKYAPDYTGMGAATFTFAEVRKAIAVAQSLREAYVALRNTKDVSPAKPGFGRLLRVAATAAMELNETHGRDLIEDRETLEQMLSEAQRAIDLNGGE